MVGSVVPSVPFIDSVIMVGSVVPSVPFIGSVIMVGSVVPSVPFIGLSFLYLNLPKVYHLAHGHSHGNSKVALLL